MALCTWALLLLAATAASADLTRVTGGQEVDIESYPYALQVDFLQVDSSIWSQACAGALVNNRWVLSAAQCFSGASFPGVSHRRIRAGTTLRNAGGVLLDITRVINHPEYGLAADRDADVSLAHLATLVTFNNAIQPVSINQAGSEVPVASAVRLLGWGKTRLNGPTSLHLRTGVANTLALEACASRYDNGAVTSNMLCTLSTSSVEQTSCRGDVGGPVVLNDVAVGIISWGNGCILSSYPAIHTKVSAYTSWIVANAV